METPNPRLLGFQFSGFSAGITLSESAKSAALGTELMDTHKALNSEPRFFLK